MKKSKTAIMVIVSVLLLSALVIIGPWAGVRLYQGNRVIVNLHITMDGKSVSLKENGDGFSLKNNGQTLSAKAKEYGRFEYSLIAENDNGNKVPINLTVTHFNWWEIIRSELYIDIDTKDDSYRVSENYRYTAEGFIYRYEKVSEPEQTVKGIDNINILVGYSG